MASPSTTQKLPFGALIALVVGSMIGAGVFSLPATFARATGVYGALIAWAIAGSGMLMLAFVFQSLAVRKPELDSGVFAYVQDGFGNYMGFISAFGFWSSACIGNVSYFTLIKSTLGAFFPVFGDGNTIQAVVVASVILWAFHYMILRGVKEAASINTIATIAKIVPIFIFIGVMIFSFNTDIFSANLWGYETAQKVAADLSHLAEYGYVGHAAELMPQVQPESLFTQVRSTMLITVFVFLGIEGASVYSRYARNRREVGLATVLGFLGVLATFVLVSVLAYSVMARADIAALRQPSVAGVLEAVVGRWGAIFVSIGLLISVLGAYLSWTLLAAEVLFYAAKNKSFPVALARENESQVPAAALWATNILVQTVLIITLFTTYAFTLLLELTSALSLVPYFLVAAYGLKLAFTGETYETEDSSQRKKALIIAGIATIYTALMLYAGGIKYILLSALIYAPGTIFFIMARKEQNEMVFTKAELLFFSILCVGAAVAAWAIFNGRIAI